jgi:alpha-ketoglutarate-dependent taurine dioxygenase
MLPYPIEQGDDLEARLRANGAVLLRGAGVRCVEGFQALVGELSGGAAPFDYAGGASPRKGMGAGVYTSTEYPPSVGLSLHNELSYADVYPRRLYFVCLVAPEEGGETTLGDSRRILARIDASVVEEFRRRKLTYLRNLSGEVGGGYSWREALGADGRSEAEAVCRRIGADFEWRAGGVLRMRQTRAATAFHPDTGEEVWFNQADGFHPSVLDAATYAEMLAWAGSEDGFRLNVTYGDGGRIDPAALSDIRAAIEAETIPYRWQQGDVLVLDNFLAAHGRRPFRGPRKIALAMT